MSRRMLDSSIWSNENFAALPPRGRLLQIGMINIADDQGRLKAHPLYLAKEIFAYDHTEAIDISKWLEQMVEHGTIALYVVEGKQYAQFLNWWQYQTLQFAHPSAYPRSVGWEDRLRFNSKGNHMLVANWTTPKGERMQDTCDQDGKPLPFVMTLPVKRQPENPVAEAPALVPTEVRTLVPAQVGTQVATLAPTEVPTQVTSQLLNFSTSQLSTKRSSSSLPSSSAPEKSKDDDDDDSILKSVVTAWNEGMPEKATTHIQKKLKELIAECGPDMVIGGILAAIEGGGRSFKYVATCTRNLTAPVKAAAKGSYLLDENDRYAGWSEEEIQAEIERQDAERAAKMQAAEMMTKAKLAKGTATV